MSIDFQHYNSLQAFKEAFSDEAVCLETLTQLRWPSFVESPFSEFGQVYRCKNSRYRCRDSNRYFTAKTGTIFHGSKIPLTTWFTAMFLLYLNPVLTTEILAETVGLPLKSARKVLKTIQSVKHHIPQRPNLSLTDWLQQYKV